MKLKDGSEYATSQKKLKSVREFLEGYAYYMGETRYHSSSRMRYDFIAHFIEESDHNKNTVMNIYASALRRIQNTFIKENYDLITFENRFRISDVFLDKLTLDEYIALVNRAADLDKDWCDDTISSHYKKQ